MDDLKQLRQRLKKANCIYASNYSSFQSYPESAYISIGFPTDDLYSLDYNIFLNNLDSKDITEMAKACNIKKVHDQVLVRYTGHLSVLTVSRIREEVLLQHQQGLMKTDQKA